MTSDWTVGDVVTYIDDSATTTDGTVLVTGPINGEPIATSERVFVPVWSERDNGREATTVYVAAENIVTPHAGDNPREGEVR